MTLTSRRDNLNARRARISWFRTCSEVKKEKIKNFFEDYDVFVNRHGYIEEGKSKKLLLNLKNIAKKNELNFSISFPR